MAQERWSKPDGFVEKMYELVMDIDARNMRLAQTQRQNDRQPVASAYESIPTFKARVAGFSTFRDQFRTSSHEYINQAILSGSLVWNGAREWIRCVYNAINSRLQGRILITLCLGWVLGLITIWLVNYQIKSSAAMSVTESMECWTRLMVVLDG